MKNVYTKSDSMLDLIDGLFDSSIDCGDGVESYPTTLEIRDKNYFDLHTRMIVDGYKICTAPVLCFDGKEYKITEIRGPKASGFFFAKFL